jgi:iron complex outermembrane recepter protein
MREDVKECAHGEDHYVQKIQKKFLLSSAMLASIIASPAMAQSPSDSAQDKIGDIVVTARKESENLQSTPVAVTALSTAALAKAQIVQVFDLQKTTPSLNTGTGGTGGPSISYLSIRGQAQNSPNSASDAAVGTYVDGVYYGRPTSGNLGFLDVAQAEILRGPQGTLFGRNTTGGALNITTTMPGGEVAGYVKLGYGNYDAKRVEGAVTIPIQGDQLGVRLAGRFSQRDGYLDNPITGNEQQDVDHDYALRGTIKWEPDNLPVKLVVSADKVDYEDNGGATAVIGQNPGFYGFYAGSGYTPQQFLVGVNGIDGMVGTGQFDQTYGDHHLGVNGGKVAGLKYGAQDVTTPFNTADSGGVSANLDVDFGAWQLKSITAYREANSENSFDLDGTPLDFIGFDSFYHQNQYSQELQATTQIGNLHLIAGAFYFKEEGDESSMANFFFSPTTRLTLGNFEAESKAVFIQGNYDITDKLRATAGFRYTSDSRQITKRGRTNIAFGAPLSGAPTGCGGVGAAAIVFVPGVGCSSSFDGQYNYPAYTVGLDYRMNENLFMYIKSSGAAMAGGINTRDVPPANATFNPEKVKDIEIGAKIDLFDRRLRTNVAIFHSEGESTQRIVNTFLPGAGLTQYATNAGDTENNGVELEVTALPWKGLELTGNVAYLDAGYKDGTFLEDRGVAAGGVVDRSGEPIPYAPEWQYTVGATQDLNTSVGLASFHVDYTFIDDKVISTTSPNANASAAARAIVAEEVRLTTIGSYGLLNARASLALANSGAEISIWGKNLTDEQTFVNLFDGYTSLGFVTANQAAPLTYGVQLTYDF